MTPHKEWFYEYEKYNGEYVFLEDDSTPKIIRHGRVKLFLKDARIEMIPRVFHIAYLC